MRPVRLYPVWLPDGSAVALLPADHEIQVAGLAFRSTAPDWSGPWRRSWRDAANDATYRFTTHVTFPLTCERCKGIGRELEVFDRNEFHFGSCLACKGSARSKKVPSSVVDILRWGKRVDFVWPDGKSELVRGVVMSKHMTRRAAPGLTFPDNDPISYSAKGAFGESKLARA